MGKMLEKVNKSELWVTLAALLSILIAPQLDMSEETMEKLILGVLALAGVYTAGRSYAKPREEASKAGKSLTVVHEEAPRA